MEAVESKSVTETAAPGADDAPDAVLGAEPAETGLHLVIDALGSLNLACHQNDVVPIRSLQVLNGDDRARENLVLSVSSSPPALRRTEWKLDRIAARRIDAEGHVRDGEIRIEAPKIELDHAILAGLDESEMGDLVFELRDTSGLLATHRQRLRLLARDEWGGANDMAAMLAAHVSPNHPAVAPMLKSAANVLEAHGHSRALDGYQSEDPRRAYMLCAALWAATCELGLDYAEPPASFETQGQKVRDPGRIAREGLATCLDTTLLLAALAEAAGLNATVIVQREHAFAGVWLKRRSLDRVVEPDPVELRKAIAAREFVAFETTLVCQRPPAGFEQACAEARQRLGERHDVEFVAAIDIARARAMHVRPLASMEAAAPGDAAVPLAPSAPALPPLPDLDAMPPDVFEAEPSTPKDRIERWQAKLLDLTLNNRLLNFKPTARTVPFVLADAGALEDRLADGVSLALRAVDPAAARGDRDEGSMVRSGLAPIMQEAARDAFARDELVVPLDEADATRRLTTLYRQARSDLAEGGTNTLFLAIGALRWRKKAGDARVYSAPLLLVPVKLERRSAASGFRLKHFDEDVRFNTTLLEYLRREFEVDVPQLEGELPLDESGVDVALVHEIMRARVRDVPGFEVVEEATLATFSFAKYLMWKDLTERTDALRRNRVVRHLIDTPDEAFSSGGHGTFPRAEELDTRYDPADFACPLPADSSQLSAVKAAAEGHDFVIVGPPGTGKSQTIANIIAQVLFEGRSVLFVAEKVAALDVVYRRLAELGLGDVCLELHSNKADRRRFLAQLGRAWEARTEGSDGEWVRLSDDAKVRRDRLNAYVAALHAPQPHGESVFEAIARLADHRVRGEEEPALPAIPFEALDRTALDELATLSDALLLAHAPVAELSPDDVRALELVHRTEFSNAWLRELQTAVSRLREANEKRDAAALALLSALGLPKPPEWTAGHFEALQDLLAALEETAPGDVTAFERDGREAMGGWTQLREHVETAQSAREALTVPFDPDELSRVPADDLDRHWRAAAGRMWPFSFFRRRAVRRELDAYGTGERSDPARDLPAIRRFNEAVAAAKAQAGFGYLGQAIERIDVEAVDARFSAARALHERMRSLLSRFPLESDAAGQLMLRLRAICEQGTAGEAADRFAMASEHAKAAATAFADRAGGTPPESDLAALDGHLRRLETRSGAVRDWVAWTHARERAEAAGLKDVVVQVRAGRLQDAGAAVRAAYAQWWLPRAMDADPCLREFQGHVHARTIEEFRELTERVRDEAALMVLRRAGHALPPPDRVPAKSELGMLRHQIGLKRPSKSIRAMVQDMPQQFGELAPCLLMSPLSIAQYLPHDAKAFDVVIFDEASQITTWDAVGAIARGDQTVIVGDPKQLPPTNFFGRTDEGTDEDAEFWTQDQASILDEAAAAGLPRHTLRWHYRSRHEELIAFSNERYYDNRLITFPSPHENSDAVTLRRVADGVYDRGKSRTNRVEARALADRAAALMRHWLAMDEAERPTLGVVTFNAQQQALISDLLDEARLADPDLEWFFSDDRVEATMVRNLENVQGDERDVILFSLTFAPDAAGKFTMNFGALNADGGERRLNVAVTRARQRLEVFASFGAEDIDLSRTGAAGVGDLKRFLDYAARGAVALAAADEGSLGGYDSPFEREVAEALRSRGWNVRTQIGVSGYRIDLAVVHPNHAGAYLAGIECDGATYHSSATARDRDMVREAVLRGLGWEIERVWSTEWWQDAARVLSSLDARLRELAQGKVPNGNAAFDPPVHAPNAGEPEPSPMPAPDVVAEASRPAGAMSPSSSPDLLDGPPAKAPAFQAADLSGFAADAERFPDRSYDATIRRMAAEVLAKEAPVRADVLAARIARAHGWQRTGRRIRERIDEALPPHERTAEEEGTFLWQPGTVTRMVPWRGPADPLNARSTAEIADAELRGLLHAHPRLRAADDPALAFARHIGLARLAGSTRDRLERLLREITVEAEASAEVKD